MASSGIDWDDSCCAVVIASGRFRRSLLGRLGNLRERRDVDFRGVGLEISFEPGQARPRRILSGRCAIDLFSVKEARSLPRVCGGRSLGLGPARREACNRKERAQRDFRKVEQLYALRVERGLDGELLVEGGLGHQYPHGFESKLRGAVDFVLGTDAKAEMRPRPLNSTGL